MSPRIAGLGDMPALTAGYRSFQPGPTSPPPTGPGTGNGGRPGPQVTPKACGCGVLDGEDCDCAEFAAQARAAARNPIFFDFRKAAA